MFAVRPFQPADREALAALTSETWPGFEEDDELLLAKCRRGLMVVLVANGSLRGYGAAFSWSGALPQFLDRAPAEFTQAWWHLHDITVHPAFQQQGAGRRLLAALIDEGRGRGFRDMRAVAVSPGGSALLRSFGFIPSEDLRAPDCYGHPAVVMVRRDRF